MKCVVDDLKDANGNWLRSYTIDHYQYHTYSSVRWKNMLKRTKIGGEYQSRNPTYIGTTVSENFLDFQWFTNWHREQVGYGLPDYALEKDILVSGNKKYSENNCVLVPKSLNSFLIAPSADRGLPQGVSFDARCGLYQVDLQTTKGKLYLGKYASGQEAGEVYKVAKEAEARRWYERLKACEFLVDNRVIERMREWRLV